jgi:hypothetical protein
VEIKIDKKFFIKLGCLIVFGVTCFLTGGLFFRSRGISGTGEQLVSGIVLERDTANKLLDELGIARPAGQSAVDTGYAVLRGVQELSKSNDAARLCISEIEREVDLTQQNAEIIKQSFDGVSDAIEYGWRIAEEQAAAYERIIETLQQFNSNTGEDDKESTSGPRDSQ